MIALLAIAAVSAAAGDGQAVDADQFLQMIKTQSTPLKSLAFVYEGSMRWIGPRNLIKDPDGFGEQYQGTYLYRSDGAALYDVYISKFAPGSGVQRNRMATRNGRFERLNLNYDAKWAGQSELIAEGVGSVENFDRLDSPHRLFMAWYWGTQGDSLRQRYRFEGWEEVDGRNCLRFAIVGYRVDPKDTQNFRRYWIDVKRNAHVVKMEYIEKGKLTGRIDGIVLAQFPLPDGSRYWLPVRSRSLFFGYGNQVLTEPAYERSIAVVAGSVQLNSDLPDALFSLRRDSALPLPGELEKLKRVTKSSDLRRRFEAQPAPPPLRTDPVSVRKRIDENLAEANRQSQELQASSPARQTWAWSSVLPYGFALLGVALLAGVVARKWRHG